MYSREKSITPGTLNTPMTANSPVTRPAKARADAVTSQAKQGQER
jgi:hypothetical protein